MAGKITGVNVDGQVYEFVAGQAVSGACSALSTDWVKPLTLPEGTDLVGGLIISVLFLNGNSVGFKGAKTVYSSDGENFYYDQAMTDPVTLPPEGCYSMTLVSGDEYSFSAWPVMTYGGITLPICDSRGHKSGGPLWDAGDTVSIIFYATGYVILAGGEGISMEVYPTLEDAEQDLPNLDEGQFIATEEGDNAVALYVKNQNILSDYESITIGKTAETATTMQYDGYINIIANSAGTLNVYLNGETLIYYRISGASYCDLPVMIAVKKGDVIYTNNVTTSASKARFYKLRDYTGR